MQGILRSQWHRAGSALALSVALACSAPPDRTPPAAPLVGPHALTLARWTGGPLSGPAALGEAPPQSAPSTEPDPGAEAGDSERSERSDSAVALAPGVADAVRVRLTITALEGAPDGGRPIAEASAVVADLSGATALAVDNPLRLGGRVATGADAVAWQRAIAGTDAAASARLGRREQLAVRELIVPAGSTAVLAVGAIDVEPIADDFLGEYAARGPFPQRAELSVALDGGAVAVAVAVQRRDGTGDADGEPARQSAVGAEAPVAPRALRRDLALLDVGPVRGGAPVVALAPSPLAGGAARWLAFGVEVLAELSGDATAPGAAAAPAAPLSGEVSGTVTAGAAPGPAGELQRARAAVAAADTLHAAVAEAPDPERQLDRLALAAIAADDGRRTALLSLADRRGAPLAAALATVLDADELGVLCAPLADVRVEAQSAAAGIGASGATQGAELGWQLERAALRYAAAALSGAAPPLALDAVLVARGGHAARFPGLLDDIARGARSVAEADAWFVQENLVHLEDSDPAARVRAERWLAPRGAVPANYDALGSAEARRAALRAAREGVAP